MRTATLILCCLLAAANLFSMEHPYFVRWTSRATLELPHSVLKKVLGEEHSINESDPVILPFAVEFEGKKSKCLTINIDDNGLVSIGDNMIIDSEDSEKVYSIKFYLHLDYKKVTMNEEVDVSLSENTHKIFFIKDKKKFPFNIDSFTDASVNSKYDNSMDSPVSAKRFSHEINEQVILEHNEIKLSLRVNKSSKCMIS